MRIPNATHRARPWRIHALVPDFRLEDAWALDTPGDTGDFPRLVRLFASMDPARGASRAARLLFAIRERVGTWLAWDDASTGLGARVPSLRERLPEELRDAPLPEGFERGPFRPLFAAADEFAAEIANQTVHAVLHLGWVPDGAGGHRGEMAVYARPNGGLGRAYMMAIRPFRHAIVYPALLRAIGRAWRESAPT